MPDNITPVGTQVKYDPMQGINMLSGVLGLKQQQQQLQIGQGEAQKSQQLMHERQSVQQMMQSGKDDQGQSIVGENGEPDPAKVLPALGRMAPLSGQQYAQNILKTHSDKIGLQESSRALDMNHRNALQGMVQSVASGMDPQEAINTMRNYATQHPEAAATEKYMEGFVQHIGNANPEQRPHLAQSLASMMQPGQAVETRPQNAAVETGTETLLGPQAPPVAGGQFTPTSAVKRKLPPQVVRLPNEQLRVISGDTGLGGAGSGAAQQPITSKLPAMTRPGPNAPKADQDNYQNRISQLGDHYTQISTAANNPMNGVQATRFRNQQVLDLAPHASTGPGMKLLNTLASRLPGATGDTYQDVEHYTAQNSAALAKLMGVPNTNMGAETAAAAAGNVERNPGALKEITRANDALNTAFDLYNRGMARVTNNGSDMSRAESYRQAFGQNLDINAVRWADAHRRGDQEEISALNQKLGPDGIKKAQQTLRTLKNLAERGDLQ